MKNDKALFAFKLASQQTDAKPANDGKWKAGEGSAVAGGCSEYLYPGNLRYDSWWWGRDEGDWC